MMKISETLSVPSTRSLRYNCSEGSHARAVATRKAPTSGWWIAERKHMKVDLKTSTLSLICKRNYHLQRMSSRSDRFSHLWKCLYSCVRVSIKVLAYGKWTENLPAFDADGTPQADVIIFTYAYVLIVNIVLMQVVVAGNCKPTFVIYEETCFEP